MIRFTVNDKVVEVNAEQDMPLLWVIRDLLKLNGTKFGCGLAQCGACTVHVEGEPVRSCVTTVGSIAGKKITTIEGLNDRWAARLKAAWTEVDVPQCGYCQSGQLMSAHYLLRQNPRPDDRAIDEAMRGNLCRCGTYQRIREAIKQASEA
jgi:aerobic-type carbon monoxide dehydrogenase small subunit (CoxS/CutS family)